jgi:ABC-type Fe3+/spermidine/putrescine transport system ATPase subunit
VPRLSLEGLEKRYGEQPVVAGVTLAIEHGEFVSLLGPSGCGKTTILRIVAGLALPSAGRVRVEAEDITALPPERRKIGLVFQSYALFPHLTVRENVAFGLRRQGFAGAALGQRVGEALAAVRLTGLDERYPRQLSGGQQQRVALARAIAPRPQILLLDEPLSNLDAALRDEMQIELKRLQRELGITTVFVTHDQTEALAMSDRVCVLSDGRVQQFGTPEEIYHRPANGFVARFIGRPNRLHGRLLGIEGDLAAIELAPGLRIGATAVPLSERAPGRAAEGGAVAGSAVELVLRQEDVRLVPAADAGAARTPSHAARIVLRSFAGARVQYVLAAAGGVELVAEVPTGGADAGLAAGAEVHFAIDPARVHWSAAGGAGAAA